MRKLFICFVILGLPARAQIFKPKRSARGCSPLLLASNFTSDRDDLQRRGFHIRDNESESTLTITHPANAKLLAEASLSEKGVLDFAIYLKTKSGRYRVRGLKGSEFVDLAMVHFGDRIKGIRGSWSGSDSVNLKSFNQLTGSGVGLIRAALSTWTGHQAARWGFARPAFEALQGFPGNYTYVRVIFHRGSPGVP